jgi:glutaminase
LSVTCRDLAIMAATLANRGANPISGKRALRGEYVENVLSVMGSCGMYDYAGEWIYNVGMPAKSGVAGGIIAVLPGQLGIGVFSPRLDARGNSVRGIRVCQALARHLDLHVFNHPRPGQSTIRLQFTADQLTSCRVRTHEESHVLRQFGSQIRGYQLQGNLNFTTMEPLVSEVTDEVASIDYLLLDLKRVLTLNESACRLFFELLSRLSAMGKSVVFAHSDHLALLRRYMKARLEQQYTEKFRLFEDHDPALEWCENQLLAAKLPGHLNGHRVPPERYELFQGLLAEEIQLVVSRLKRREFQPGEAIVSAGEEANELFLLARGHVSVLVQHTSGVPRRLATFSAGMAFGEMAIIDHARRSANIVADTEVECDLLELTEFQSLADSHPNIKIKLLENLCLGLSRKLRKANRDISALD